MEMPPEIIDKARADLRRAEAMEARAEEALQSAKAERVRLIHFLEQCERYAAEDVKPEGRGVSNSALLVQAAHEIIVERGPIMIGDLTTAVLARGLTIGGDKPRSNLAGFLSRASAKGTPIEYVDGIGWRAKKIAEAVGTASGTSSPRAVSIPATNAPDSGGDLDDEIPF